MGQSQSCSLGGKTTGSARFDIDTKALETRALKPPYLGATDCEPNG